jgi:ribosomal protein S26
VTRDYWRPHGRYLRDSPTYKANQGGNVSDSSVRSHQMAYCDRCGRSFPHDGAYEQHKSASHSHWLCDSCDIDFASEESLVQHYGNSPRHHYCKECERHFDSAKSKMQHMEAKHWYCEAHNRVRVETYGDDDPVALSLESYRSSIPSTASNRTTERVATTSIA